MNPYNETEPNLRPINGRRDGVPAPPRLLLISVMVLFLFVVVGTIGGVVVFRDVLRPSQQQRIIDQLPFMRGLLPPTPEGGILPTVVTDNDTNDAALDLLAIPLDATTEVTTEATIEPTAEPTEVIEVATTAPTPTQQLEPTQAETPLPSPSPTEMTENIATPEPVVQTVASNIPPSGRMFGFVHQQQEWNNCGPATITMALSYFGWQNDQIYAKDRLKPNREDKNVSPHELAGFVNEETGVRAIVRMGGNLDILRALIANNFPIVVERGIMFEASDWLGHYQTLVAYDDAQQLFYAYDSFMGTGDNGEGVTEGYSDLDEHWRQFNRTFIVVYEEAREPLLRTILGSLWDQDSAAETALETALAEAQRNRADAHAWFNAGTSLVALGRYQEAANAFDLAIQQRQLPWRMLWYQFGPFEAYYQTGRYDEVLALVQSNLNGAEELEESYYWRGRVFAAQGQVAQAAAEFRRALNYNPNFSAARAALEEIS